MQKISDEERIFCELFVNGCAPYAGNAAKCYEDAFHKEKGALLNHEAKKLLKEPRIVEYLEELESISAEEARDMKRFLTANLKSIIEETSSANFTDRKGRNLSPAALRSVAVNASKALMELYPVKEAQINKIDIDGGESGITFNVIVPNPTPKTNE